MCAGPLPRFTAPACAVEKYVEITLSVAVMAPDFWLMVTLPAEVRLVASDITGEPSSAIRSVVRTILARWALARLSACWKWTLPLWSSVSHSPFAPNVAASSSDELVCGAPLPIVRRTSTAECPMSFSSRPVGSKLSDEPLGAKLRCFVRCFRLDRCGSKRLRAFDFLLVRLRACAEFHKQRFRFERTRRVILARIHCHAALHRHFAHQISFRLHSDFHLRGREMVGAGFGGAASVHVASRNDALHPACRT